MSPRNCGLEVWACWTYEEAEAEEALEGGDLGARLLGGDAISSGDAWLEVMNIGPNLNWGRPGLAFNLAGLR